MKTLSTTQLAKSVNSSPDVILKLMEREGIKPKMVSTTPTGYTFRMWGADAVKAAKRFREEAEARKAATKIVEKASPSEPLSQPAPQEHQSSAPTPNNTDAQVLHRFDVVEEKVDTAIDLLAQILDHLTRPGAQSPSDAFKAFLGQAVGALGDKTDD